MANAKTSASGKATSDATLQDLSEQIETLKADIAALTETLGDYGAAKTKAAKEAARDKAAELHASGRATVAKAQNNVEEFVQTQPATALGLAAGIGFLVGVMASARR
ncbi:DUF883 domain-containing protein [uncultured Sulfitobacter sp.]|uniref:DUF883 domain-containing protein n=1 Tax=uncultured Sulfitobacter sp. TaxID=191468 RepID=UPI00260161B7|nr:DUF883 domain-containing protein [uncultured Sulfitobacter sp.]